MKNFRIYKNGLFISKFKIKSHRFFSRKIFLITILYLIIFAIAFGFAFYSFFPARITDVQVGSIAQENIIAKRTVSFIDVNKTNELREKIAESVSPVYRFDTKKQQSVSNNTDKFFSDLISIISLDAKEEEKKLLLDNTRHYY